jgi:uncharacterized protein (TIGR00269 family)
MLKCTFCGRKAVYNRRYAGTLLCDRCLIKSVERRFRRAVAEHKLIAPNEKIAVAVSGGKDSVVALHLISDYCKRKNCEVVAITVDEGIKGYRDHSLPVARENARELGIEHSIVSFREAYGATLDQMVKAAKKRKSRQHPCTYCGVMRRSLLNQAARELGADKLATAHNLDDEAQAIMLNYVRGDFSRLHRLGPIYSPREGFVPRIKPMREIPEKEIALYALLKNMKVHLAVCPYARGIHTEIRDFLNDFDVKHPNTKFMIVRMFDRMKPQIARALLGFSLKKCKVCGEPTPGGLCKTCELLKDLGLSKCPK